eukprot:scaffold10715_cov114-Isochrysis_galbana.AAC.9
MLSQRAHARHLPPSAPPAFLKPATPVLAMSSSGSEASAADEMQTADRTRTADGTVTADGTRTADGTETGDGTRPSGGVASVLGMLSACLGGCSTVKGVKAGKQD